MTTIPHSDRFDPSRLYVTAYPKSERSWYAHRATSGDSFQPTLHRPGCRYLKRIDPSRLDYDPEFQGMTLADMFAYAHAVPEKVCRVCMGDYVEYMDTVDISFMQGRANRARWEQARVETVIAHGEWYRAVLAAGLVPERTL